MANVNGRDLLGNDQQQIAVSNECARLLTNCIIYYNAVLLNGLMEKAKKRGDKKMCDLIKRLSPVAWTHIHFQGKFDFGLASGLAPIDIEAFVALLESVEL